MSSTRKMLVSILLLAMHAIAFAAANAPSLSIHEKAGPYPVGFRVLLQYDYSRLYRSAYDPLGHPFTGERARPIQTLIWYPGKKSARKPITNEEYGALGERDGRNEPYEIAAEKAAAEKDNAPHEPVPMWAVKDDAPAAGKFPVVIYSPGLDDDAAENTSMCEYLASYGYVVISSPSVGAEIGPEAGVVPGTHESRDIIFLVNFAQTLPNVNPNEIAVAGYSYGGVGTFFAAARDHRIKAEVAYDGHMRVNAPLVKAAEDVHAEEMTIPLFFFGGIQRPNPAEDLRGDRGTDNFLYGWKHGNVYTAWLQHVHHGGFPQGKHPSYAINHVTDPHERDVWEASMWIQLYTRTFLDASLKQDKTSLAFLGKTAEEVGLPSSIMVLTSRPAQGAPPTFDAFRDELGRRGYEHAAEIYEQMHKEFPVFTLWEGSVNAWLRALIAYGKPSDAIGLLQAYREACPNYAEVYYYFGQAYEKADQKATAISNYQHALQLDPTLDRASDRLKALTADASQAQ